MTGRSRYPWRLTVTLLVIAAAGCYVVAVLFSRGAS